MMSDDMQGSGRCTWREVSDCYMMRWDDVVVCVYGVVWVCMCDESVAWLR